MTDSRIPDKKVVIPLALAIAVAAVGLAILLPSFAFAQNGTNTTTNSNEQKTTPSINGSINVNEAIQNFLTDNVKTGFADASTTAAAQVTNGKVVAGRLGVVQGFLVYTFKVVNSQDQTGYLVIVDAGNGTVLYKSEGRVGPFGGGMFGYGCPDGGMGYGKGGMWKDHQGYGGMMKYSKPSASAPTEQSSLTEGQAA